MPKTGFKLDKSWNKMSMALDPSRLDPTMRRNIRLANQLNGKILEAEIRDVIAAGRNMAPNRPLTVAIKGENKPLVGPNNSIFQAVTSVVKNDLTVFAGVLATDGAFNIALIIHEGTEITVTTAMRGMFFSLWQASTGQIPASRLTGRARELWDQMSGGWLPLKNSTAVIIIPARPFVKEAMKASGIELKIVSNWTQAIQKSMRDAGRSG